MLCDNVEAEAHLEKNKEFAKAMNSKMDEKLEKIKQAKLAQKEQLLEKSVKNSIDKRSGILLRENTRTLTEDEIQGKVGSREFISIEKIDRKDMRDKNAVINQVNGFFTIGVVTEKSPIIVSKTGKKFSILKISDLTKYDLNKLKSTLDQGAQNAEETKLQMKSYTANGYKQVTLFCFGPESASYVQTLRAGCIILVLNPKYSKPKPDALDKGFSFSIDSPAQFDIIGYSQDYDICKGRNKHP